MTRLVGRFRSFQVSRVRSGQQVCKTLWVEPGLPKTSPEKHRGSRQSQVTDSDQAGPARFDLTRKQPFLKPFQDCKNIPYLDSKRFHPQKRMRNPKEVSWLDEWQCFVSNAGCG